MKLVIFDLDGTLADTSPGILNSHRHTLRSLCRPVPAEAELRAVIGGPLLETYRTRFGFPEAEAREALRVYRQWYAEHGIHQAALYDGIPRLLERLRGGGVHTAVATLKAEPFARTMLAELGVGDRFDCVYGVDAADSRTKEDLLRLCMAHVGASPAETVLVGDSVHDRRGAAACGTGFVGVGYGFGFRGETGLCASPEEVYEALRRRDDAGKAETAPVPL